MNQNDDFLHRVGAGFHVERHIGSISFSLGLGVGS